MLFKKVTNALVSAILPPKCICGKTYTAENASICTPCWVQIDFIGTPMCQTCGTPFDFKIKDATSENLLCNECISNPPLFKLQRCAFNYNKNSSFVITKFKYSDSTHAAKYLAHQLYNISKDFIDEIDIITSVPMHPKKLAKRKYNQAALLANALGKLAKKPVNNLILKRTKNNLPQAGLQREERINNVKNSFELNAKYHIDIKGKNILLIDDVITTGATILECTKILAKSELKNIFVVALGRTLL